MKVPRIISRLTRLQIEGLLTRPVWRIDELANLMACHKSSLYRTLRNPLIEVPAKPGMVRTSSIIGLRPDIVIRYHTTYSPPIVNGATHYVLRPPQNPYNPILCGNIIRSDIDARTPQHTVTDWRFVSKFEGTGIYTYSLSRHPHADIYGRCVAKI